MVIAQDDSAATTCTGRKEQRGELLAAALSRHLTRHCSLLGRPAKTPRLPCFKDTDSRRTIIAENDACSIKIL